MTTPHATTRWEDYNEIANATCKRKYSFVEGHPDFEIWRCDSRDGGSYYYAQFTEEFNHYLLINDMLIIDDYGLPTDASLRRQLVTIRQEAYATLKGKAHPSLKREIDMHKAWAQGA